MTPDDNQNRRVGTPLIPQRPSLHTDRPARDATSARTAVANMTRDELDGIYQRSAAAVVTPPAQQSATTPSASTEQAANPYERTHAETVTSIQAEQWSKYHSAWQEYYQKYYERYYVAQVHEALKRRPVQPTSPSAVSDAPGMSQAEAMTDLKSRLLTTLRSRAHKARRSRHFLPTVAALSVMLVFLFLQYNSILFATVAAYVSPGNIDPANYIVDPTTSLSVSPDPKLIIPKIDVDVPVLYNTTPDYNSQMAAMQQGVAYFGIPGADSKPGQIGNTVMSGHSSNDIFDKGNYKFIFARLDQLQTGDPIYVNYQGTRYTYTVTKKQVVAPTDVQALVYPTSKPVLTLITCTPLGTSLNRLLVTAEQVSPDPSTAAPAPAANGGNPAATIPGNSPTLLQSIFGGGN